jgi:hypothetical protein
MALLGYLLTLLILKKLPQRDRRVSTLVVVEEVRRDNFRGIPWDKLLVATRWQQAHRDGTECLLDILVGHRPTAHEALKYRVTQEAISPPVTEREVRGIL